MILLSCMILGNFSRAWSDSTPVDQLVVGAAGAATGSGAVSKEEKKTSPPAEAQKKKGLVKIATIGAAPLSVGGNTPPQKIVERMIDFWRGKLAQVLPDRPDLIVLPEVCDRPGGLSQEKLFKYYQVRKDQIQKYFADVARKNNCYIVYPTHRILEDGSWRNSGVLIDRAGEVAGIYNKNHPTIHGLEKGIRAGRKATIIECDFGRVGLAICFDLNFDELRLQYAQAKPDLIVFSSVYHGGLMQGYWAYSCRCHFVGAISGKGTPSEIRNPLGEVVATTTNYFDFVVATVNLDCELAHLDYNWGRLRKLKAKYGPKVKITDPGLLAPVLIASEHETITVAEMIKEFEIELLDDYLARSRAFRKKPGHVE